MAETAVARALKMFGENRFLTLGTVSGNDPWVAPINYVIGPGPHLHFYSAVESRHAADVADRDLGAARRQQRADPVAQAGEVGAGDRAADREPDRGRHTHQEVDRSPSEKSSTLER